AKKAPEIGNNGVRYYLFRAISSTLAVPSKTPLVKAANEEKAVQVALDFVARTPAFAKNTPREELEGYKVLRREALKVIARSRTAAFGKSQPALALPRYAADHSALPQPPRVDERMESAMGLCRLINKAKDSPGFQTDYAAANVVRAVAAFAKAANREVDTKKGIDRS